jgi:hypothetical protein
MIPVPPPPSVDDGKPSAVSQPDQPTTSAEQGLMKRRRSSRHHMRRWVRRLLVPKARPSSSQDATALEAERRARMRILIRQEEQSLLMPSKTALRKMVRESGKGGRRPEAREMSVVWTEIYGRS